MIITEKTVSPFWKMNFLSASIPNSKIGIEKGIKSSGKTISLSLVAKLTILKETPSREREKIPRPKNTIFPKKNLKSKLKDSKKNENMSISKIATREIARNRTKDLHKKNTLPER